MKILLVAGARPNFMKISSVVDAINCFNRKEHKRSVSMDYSLVHTGQHYDDDMSKSFFDDLKLPRPDVYLGVGSGTHAEQTGKIMIGFERVCVQYKPDLIIVVGDVNSTIACALVAVKLYIPVAHVEAGLRSFDRTMPEEINRILTDQISDYLFTTCLDANVNLKEEGISENKIFFVGNVMIDALLKNIEISQNSRILERLKLRNNGVISRYAVLTLHRPSNVDDPVILKGIISALNKLSKSIPVIFPAHPRTLERVKQFRLEGMVGFVENIKGLKLDDAGRKIFVLTPLGYIDFLSLMSNAKLVLTDSGGLQEEATILGIPCLTLRDNTERPITVKEGTNRIVGNNPDKIVSTARDVLNSGIPRKRIPEYWDGKAAERIIDVLANKF